MSFFSYCTEITCASSVVRAVKAPTAFLEGMGYHSKMKVKSYTRHLCAYIKLFAGTHQSIEQQPAEGNPSQCPALQILEIIGSPRIGIDVFYTYWTSIITKIYRQTCSYRNQNLSYVLNIPLAEKAIWFVTKELHSKSDFVPSLVCSVI